MPSHPPTDHTAQRTDHALIHSLTFKGYDLRSLPTPKVTPGLLIAEIQRVVAAYYRLPVAEMTSDRRAREVARPRQVAMYLAKLLTLRSLPDIGRRFGNRDHTTVIHAIKQIKRLSETDYELAADVKRLTTLLEGLR